MAAIGTIIDGKYEIVAEIGRGGMSVVYLAMDRRLNKQWAIKEAKKKPGNESAVYELTPIAEANLLKSLNHENIVRIVDIIEQDGFIYIVEDYVEGMSLAKEVERGPSSTDDVVTWGVQLCSVFEYLHSRPQPIIYRDMKPANIQLDPDRKKIKLLDFGIAKTYKVQNVGDTFNLGTRGYAAPEQFDTNRQSDARTDIFSLGVTLRALLMGKTPNQAEFYDDIRKFNPSVSDGMIKVINKATDQNPDKRFQTASEFKEALLHYHDRDDAVINFKKKKLNSFRAMIAFSISFLAIGLILLPISFGVRSADYDKKLDEKKYKECILTNPGKPDAYLKMIADGNPIEKIRNETSEKIEKVSDSSGDRTRICTDIVIMSFSEDRQKKEMKHIENARNRADFFYSLLANNKTVSSDDENIGQMLDSAATPYEALGIAGAYYSSLYNTLNADERFGPDSAKAETVIKQLNAISEFITKHNDGKGDANFRRILEDIKGHSQITQRYNINTVYDFMALLHNTCIADLRDNLIDYSKDADVIVTSERYSEVKSAVVEGPRSEAVINSLSSAPTE